MTSSKDHITLWAGVQVSHHRSNSRGLRHCASGDEMVLVCHMILKDHVTKALNPQLLFSLKHMVCHIPTFEISQLQ